MKKGLEYLEPLCLVEAAGIEPASELPPDRRLRV